MMKRAACFLVLAAVASADVGHDGGEPPQVPVMLGDSNVGETYLFNTVTRRWEAVKGGVTQRFSYTCCIHCSGKMIVWGWRGNRAFEVTALDLRKKTWEDLPKPPIDPRSYMAVAIDGSRFVLWGGTGQGGVTGDGAIFDVNLRKWTKMAAAPIDARYYASAVWIGKKVFVWGGATNMGAASDGAMYDPVGDSWKKISDSGIEGRHGAMVVSVKNKVFVWGGYTNRGPVADGAVYDADRDAWEKLPNAPIDGRGFAAATAVGNKVFVFFGYGVDGRIICHKDGASFDMNTRTWQHLPEAPIEGRYYPAMAQAGGKLYLWGGTNPNGARTVDAASFDTRGNRWEKLDDVPIQGNPPRTFIQMFYR
jgi:N-acetylneuraminic acid mutarotase